MGIWIWQEYHGHKCNTGIWWEYDSDIMGIPCEHSGDTVGISWERIMCIYICIYIYSLHTTSSTTYSLYTLYIYTHIL